MDKHTRIACSHKSKQPPMSRSKKSKKRAPSADTETEIEALREERDAAAQEAASPRQLLEDREDEVVE